MTTSKKKLANMVNIATKMDGKRGRKLYQSSKSDGLSTRNNSNGKEDRLVRALDMKRTIEKFNDLVEKSQNGQIDVGGFFAGVAPDAAMELAHIALSPDSNEKTRLAAITELLDRAGYSKVSKHAIIGQIDSTSSKRELLASIMGAVDGNKDLDIEIVDDDEE